MQGCRSCHTLLSLLFTDSCMTLPRLFCHFSGQQCHSSVAHSFSKSSIINMLRKYLSGFPIAIKRSGGSRNVSQKQGSSICTGCSPCRGSRAYPLSNSVTERSHHGGLSGLGFLTTNS